jgi:DNA polymerase III subunit epsilon
MGLSFAALDVETPNSSRGSVCSIGVAIVRDGELVAQHSWLCQPPSTGFDTMNMSIHGIHPADVE